MPRITADIDGIRATLEKLPDGRIRVAYESPPVNPFHGPATDGDVEYSIHPFQRHQYEYLNSLLPPAERNVPHSAAEQRPWWSYDGAKKDKGAGEEA